MGCMAHRRHDRPLHAMSVTTSWHYDEANNWQVLTVQQDDADPVAIAFTPEALLALGTEVWQRATDDALSTG